MKLKDISDLSNVIAAAAVVVSLLIVAWQINKFRTTYEQAMMLHDLGLMNDVQWTSWDDRPRHGLALSLRVSRVAQDLFK